MNNYESKLKSSRYFCVILAAGFSSRMGVHKPLLPVGDCAAIVRTVRSVYAAGVVPIVITGHRAENIVAALAETDAVIVHNAGFADGMFTSVALGARYVADLDARAFFLLPADCCAIAPQTFSALVGAFEQCEKIVYPAHGGVRAHPPIIPAKLAPSLAAHTPDNTGAKGFFAQYPSQTLEVSDAGTLRDMDTPSDYAEILRYLNFPTFPDISRAYEMFAKYKTASDIIAHGEQVADFCSRAGERLQKLGVQVKIPLLCSAALLHDICRAESEHERRGFELLLREGYPDAARLVLGHMTPPENVASIELELLYAYDKLLRRGELATPQQTLETLRRRFAGNEAALLAAEQKMMACAEIIAKYEHRYSFHLMNV